VTTRDEYAEQYMVVGEQLLFREKVVSRSAFHVSIAFGLVFGLAGLGGIAAFAAGQQAAPALAIGVPSLAFAILMSVLGAAFSVYRSMVTSQHVHIHFGWAKRKIAVESIQDVSAVKLEGLRQGKVSVGFDGVVRTWVGRSASGRGVAITYRDGNRTHVVTLGSESCESFMEAIEKARSGRRTDVAPARIAHVASAEAPTDAAGEALEESAEESAPQRGARRA